MSDIQSGVVMDTLTGRGSPATHESDLAETWFEKGKPRKPPLAHRTSRYPMRETPRADGLAKYYHVTHVGNRLPP
jgi:hypothetical protein